MKIQLEQIKGALRNRVDAAILQLQQEGCEIGAFFLFDDIDHQYAWRSKGKYVAIRYTSPTSGFQQYHDKAVYLKKAKNKQQAKQSINQ